MQYILINTINAIWSGLFCYFINVQWKLVDKECMKDISYLHNSICGSCGGTVGKDDAAEESYLRVTVSVSISIPRATMYTHWEGTHRQNSGVKGLQVSI